MLESPLFDQRLFFQSLLISKGEETFIGRKFFEYVFEPFLNNGFNLVILQESGNEAVSIDKLQI